MKIMFRSLLSASILAVILNNCQVQAHGFLSSLGGVVPRGVEFADSDAGVSKAPVDAYTSDFICRGWPQRSTPKATVQAGDAVTVRWDFTAAHVGDCFFYMSYDNQKTWFKFATFYDCKSQTGENVTLNLPTFLPPCNNCVIRFEWIALHLSTGPQGPAEFYSQCVDVIVQSSYTGPVPGPTVVIPGHISKQGPFRQPYNPDAPVPPYPGPPMATATDIELLPPVVNLAGYNSSSGTGGSGTGTGTGTGTGSGTGSGSGTGTNNSTTVAGKSSGGDCSPYGSNFGTGVAVGIPIGMFVTVVSVAVILVIYHARMSSKNAAIDRYIQQNHHRHGNVMISSTATMIPRKPTAKDTSMESLASHSYSGSMESVSPTSPECHTVDFNYSHNRGRI